jgi:general secretion pathway protein D
VGGVGFVRGDAAALKTAAGLFKSIQKEIFKMRSATHARSVAALFVTLCLLLTPVAVFAKKGEKNFKRGQTFEAGEQWDKAAQEYALAVAADPADAQYQLHYRRALFNASQMYMMQGRALAEQHDYVGGYNAFRQAYGYDPVNQLAVSEMERMLRLQNEKESDREAAGDGGGNGNGVKIAPTSYQQDGGGTGATPAQPDSNPGRRGTAQDQPLTPTGSEQLRIINYSGDLKAFIRSLAEQLNLNVVFDTQTFRTPKTVDINLRNVTTARALDYLFKQENLFFQKLDRRTILVADQTRRPQYQQLVLRTFYLANADPQDALRLIQQAIPAQAGRPPTIAIPDKATNSLTVRDTAENVGLIGELIASIDKDRAEVVMDVNIYEVSRTDLMQFGNQVGTDASLASLGGTSGGIFTIGGNTRAITNVLTGTPATALGTAILIPASNISALQTRSNTKLLASTQIHAFTGEESSARIGQRVPVQTAQTYPSIVTTDSKSRDLTGSGGVFGNQGFPVINYEPTGLTLKFTPQVFPNLDVQVKMSIESKDVFNPSLTPTFIERTITGTARIQNNRTMMLVSLAQDKASNGRKGLPILGLIPILGRLFSTPTKDNAQTDIVIAVTPRVLRAPAVTPEDERVRPSGTLQTPTEGSLEALVQDAEREEQLAATRSLSNKNSTVAQTPAPKTEAPAAAAKAAGTNGASVKDVSTREAEASEPPAYVPAPKELMPKDVPSNTGGASPTSTETKTVVPVPTSNSAAKTPAATPAVLAPALPGSSNAISALLKTAAVQPSMSFASGGETVSQALNVAVGEPPRLLTSERLEKAVLGSAAELRLIPERNEMRVGEKRRLALVLKTDAPLGLAVVTLRFDPRTVAIHNVATGNLFAGQQSVPTITQSVTGGVLLVSIAPPTGTPMTGAGVLVFVDIEALATGESALNFDKDNMHLIASDGRNITLQLVQSQVIIKQ